MRLAGALACLCLLGPASLCAATEDADHPLLEYAREREGKRASDRGNLHYATQLAHARHELDRARPPDDADCARSLGASQFANLYVNVGSAHEGMGNIADAVVSYRHALACRPRSVHVYRQAARALFAARDFDGARELLDQALAIDPRDLELNRLVGNLDFAGEHWADALARFRYVASGYPQPQSAAFAQLMFWVAQRRAGIADPEWAPRRLAEDWPRPILLYFKGEYGEAEIVETIRKLEDETWMGNTLDRQLASALFFVAEALWSRGDVDLARRYFAAVVNVRLVDTDEYHLALSEISKLQPR